MILNRVLIDCYIQDVLEAVGKKVEQSPSKNMLTALRLIDPDKGVKASARTYPQLWNAVESHTGELAIDSMHMYVHRPSFRATENAARIQSESYQPFLEALDAHTAANRKP